MIPKNITKEHLEKAIEEIDREGIRKGRHSSTYDLVHNDKSYPPKLVLSIANRYANGVEIQSNNFGGGKGTDAFKLLEKEGFTIKEKTKPSNPLYAILMKAKPDVEKAGFNYKAFRKDSRYVWVEDSSNTIGRKHAHYEFISRRNILYLELHFEESKSKDLFHQLINNLPEQLEWIDWNGSQSIRHKNSYLLNNHDIENKLVNDLIEFDSLIGDEVRSIIMKESSLTQTEIENGIELLCKTSSEVEGFYQSDKNIVVALNKAQIIDLKKCAEYYSNRTGVVIDIRKELINSLIEKEVYSVESLHGLIEKYKIGKEKQFRSYKETFSIVFPAITFYGHNNQRKFVESFTKTIINDLSIGDFVKEISFDFQGVRQQGSDRYWVAIYNKEQENQSKGIQFFFEFHKGRMGYGVYKHEGKTYLKPRVNLTPEEFSYKNMLKYFNDSKQLLLDDVPNKQNAIEISQDARVIYAYLKKSLSHRKIQSKILGEEAPARGGGFLAMEILHDYEIEGEKKGILNKTQFSVEYKNADGKYLEALELLKEYYPEFTDNKKNMSNMNLSLNTILYGPPGTGKTYKLKNEFFERFTDKISTQTEDEFLQELVINYSWWEVIGAILYDVRKVKVKDIAEHPLLKAKASISSNNNIRATLWGTLQAHTIEGCENVNVKVRQSPQIFNKTEDSNWEIIKENLEAEAPEIIELVFHSKQFKPTSKKKKRYVFTTFHQSFSYEDFIEGIKPIIYEDEQNPEKGKQIIYDIKPGVFKQIVKEANEDRDNDYAIFIDEINRGNIANIFGELITLIEDDKRIDTENYIPAKLPYSNEEFGVPPNLYIIGTMNTADRSVEALDTALRRRFSFIEMNPEPKKLSSDEFKCVDIDLEALLKAINARIEKLLDKDYCIGHSYFMTIKNRQKPLDELKTIFQNKILPLLQEYFYGDWGKIMLVLGKEFVESKKNTIKFLSTDSYEDFEEYDEKQIYNFTNPSSWKLDSFKSIYE